MKERIKSYISIAKKANYVIYGIDILKVYKKKLYLILIDENAGDNLKKTAEKITNNTAESFYVNDLGGLTNVTNCKIIGIKNKGLSEQIIKILRSGEFDNQ